MKIETESDSHNESESDPHVSRPPLDRSHPIRSWARWLGAEPAASGPPPPPGTDGVAASVDLGYRVVDEHVRRGQQAAREWSEAHREQRKRPPSPGDPGGMAEWIFQYASDLANVWTELVQTTAGSGLGPRTTEPSGDPGPFRFGPRPTPGSSPPAPPAPSPASPTNDGGATAVVIEIDSRRPVEIRVDIRPGSAALALVAHDLRGPESAGPRLTGVEIARGPGEEGLRARIRVPDDLPAGVYSGLVVDQGSNLPRGTIAVRIAGG